MAAPAPAAFHLLAKPAGAICNLDCKYCFYLAKERLHPGSTFRMSVEIFDEWIREDLGDVFVQAFDVALESWYLGRSSLCVFAETCGDAVVLEHRGDVYACDHFVDEAHCLGDVLETPLTELVASDGQREFGSDKRDTLPEYCRRCDVRFACHGGCPKDRFVETPDGEPGLNYLCAGYRTFFRYVDGPMRAMAAFLRAGRPAADVRKAFAGTSRSHA